MFTAVFFITLFIIQNDLVVSRSSSSSEQVIKIGAVPEQDSEPVTDINYDTTMRFPMGVVPYFIETVSYDSIIVTRIQSAMDVIEASSCVVFKQLTFKPLTSEGSWIHFTNPEEIRECVHGPDFGINGEIIIIIGYECMMSRYILHAVLHGIGFTDEVSHPHRDQYIRIMWGNIQPGYRHLFRVQQEDPQHKVVEYDPMSVMHFHDRAFSVNGGPTIAPRLPGLRIKPSEKLSQLDVMKLRLWFGHECNKRKVGALLEKCKTVFHNSPSVLASIKNENEELTFQSVEIDNVVDPYVTPKYDGIDEFNANDELNGAFTGDPAENYVTSAGTAGNEVDGEVDRGSFGDGHAGDNAEVVVIGDGNNGEMDENDRSVNEEEGAVNVEDEAENVEDGTMSVEDGTVNVEEGAVNVKDGAVNVKDGAVNVSDEKNVGEVGDNEDGSVESGNDGGDGGNAVSDAETRRKINKK